MIDAPGPRRAAEPEAPPVQPTGHARVDAVLSRAAELTGIPVAELPGHYEDLHAALVAELDAEPAAVPGGLLPRPGGEPESGGPR